QVVVGFIIYGLFFFIPAGTFEWPEAWIFLIVTFLYVLGVVFYFWKRDPTVLQSRSSVKPEKSFDTVFLVLTGIAFFSMFLITAFNVRFDGPRVPFELELIGFGIVICSFLILFLVMRENSYASKTIKVQEGQQVITTGPYAYVRHPMYIGFGMLIIAFPIALGSVFALPPAIIAIILIAVRAYYEEKTLIEELKGYKEYMQQVRYRLIPKIW
ncbi:MAG: isoprenylcysteine carboxylmethyltransferase family protein, partial [Candidatus Heimdallarchaeota archaeon]